jgi:hypothetical protein
MRRSRRLRAWAPWLGLALAVRAGADPGMPAEEWLLRDCAAGGAALGELPADDATAAVLETAIAEGLPPAVRKQVLAAADARFTRRASALSEHVPEGFPLEAVIRLRETRRGDHAERMLRSAELRYRSRALRGLLLVRPERARVLLSREADDPGSPLRGFAERLLLERP